MVKGERRASVKETRDLYLDNDRLMAENQRLNTRITELSKQIKIRDERSDWLNHLHAEFRDLLMRLLAYIDSDKR